MSKALADLLFPHVVQTPEDFLRAYPPAKGVRMRLAPSPTGQLHIGNLGTAFLQRMLVNRLGGKMFLRIEDTDQKREVEGAVPYMIAGFKEYGIRFDESPVKPGKYAPYTQSERIHIYHAFAKRLVERGLAYPCFCTAEQLGAIRERQQADKLDTGYYGQFVQCVQLPLNQVKRKIDDNVPWVLRFNSEGSSVPQTVTWVDLVRGEMSLPAIKNHPVIIKSGGLPPYNFAHVVDDLLMRTTHVIRTEEWLPSTAEHIQIWRAIAASTNLPQGTPYQYGHPPVICTEDNGKKRKISKRKDKNALVRWFLDVGYPPEAVLEYLLSLYNTNFEKWRIDNPDLPMSQFPVSFEKIGTNSPLLDMQKLEHYSRNIIAKMTCAQINKAVRDWLRGRDDAQSNAVRQNFARVAAILAIDRETDKPRKDIAKYSEIYAQYEYLFAAPSVTVSPQEAQIAQAYLATYNPADDKTVWWDKIKALSEQLACKPAVVAMTVRKLLTGREQTPDLYSVMQVLGAREVVARLNQA